MSELPAPLVPADVDLRGLEYMPLLGARLFTSDFDLEATDLEFRIGLRLWWTAWNQVPAASLPAGERSLCKLAGFDQNVSKWRKVKARALHGFELCSDGRLYHEVLAAQALIAWEKRLEDRMERQGQAARKRQERHDRSRMFEQLRALGVTPVWNVGTAELRELVTQHVTPGAEPVTVTGPPEAPPPVTVTVTAKTGRDGTGRDELREAEPSGSGAGAPADQADLIFGLGLPLLTTAGVKEPQARSFLGAMRKVLKDDQGVLAILNRCAVEKPLQPIPWLQVAMKAKPRDREAEAREFNATENAKAKQKLGIGEAP